MAGGSDSLADILARRIAQEGPVGVDAFMALALGHPVQGYYMKKDPLGAEGDFTTAPEISQMFGEMIAAFLSDAWVQMGRPARVVLAELGPGRGTLMADILRTSKSWPDFAQALDVHMVETSPILREKQKEKLAGYKAAWHESFAEVPSGFTFVVANEFLDALPVQQYVRKDGVWRERKITNDEKGFCFTDVPCDFEAGSAPDGAIAEVCPQGLKIVEEISRRLSAHGGLALFADYGHEGGFGDTLQALRGHVFVPVLENVGDSDLTAHVDFSAVKKTALAQGMTVHGPLTQRIFLQGTGIEARASKLLEKATPEQAQDIRASLARLTDEKEMGDLFKVLVMTP